MEFTSTFFLVSQILVFIAIITDALSFQFKSKNVVLFFLATSALLISLHYFFLLEIVAGIIFLISFVAYVVATKSSSRNWIYFFILLVIIPFYFLYSSWTDIVVFIGTCIAIIARFQKKDKRLREFMMIATSIIIFYNFLIFSPGGILITSIFLISNLVGYYRYYLRKG
ncbi:MAG: YgjV family protein [Candidatus Woesearchaeota archaeon]